MNRFVIFVKKEFLHIVRDTKTMVILFGLPVSLILIFGFALTNELKNTKVMVVDQANTFFSTAISARINASPYFEVVAVSNRMSTLENLLRASQVKAGIVFPMGFGASSADHYADSHLQLIIDGSDPNTAAMIQHYLSAIVQDEPQQVGVELRMLYNPQLKAEHNFVPGVMALVLMMVCVMMTSIAIVKEKELGTLEVLLASSISPLMVILTKSFPYLVLSLLNLVVILMLSVFVLGLPVNGSIPLLFFESTLFIMASLALGIFISVQTSSQQVAMLISLMGMLIPTILFSGFMFPIENMPYPLQLISNIIPAKWYYRIVQSIMLKGMDLHSIWKETLVLAGMTLFLLVLSVKSFKTRLE